MSNLMIKSDKKLENEKIMKALSEFLEPIKENYYNKSQEVVISTSRKRKSRWTCFYELKDRLHMLENFIENAISSTASDNEVLLKFCSLHGKTIEGARIILLEIIETTEFSNLPTLSIKKRCLLQSGYLSLNGVGKNNYQSMLPTVENSLQFIIESAILFSFKMDEYRSFTIPIQFRRLYDWTFALYNSLCYHYLCYLDDRTSKQELNVFLFLLFASSTIIQSMLEEIELHDEI